MSVNNEPCYNLRPLSRLFLRMYQRSYFTRKCVGLQNPAITKVLKNVNTINGHLIKWGLYC